MKNRLIGIVVVVIIVLHLLDALLGVIVEGMYRFSARLTGRVPEIVVAEPTGRAKIENRKEVLDELTESKVLQLIQSIERLLEENNGEVEGD